MMARSVEIWSRFNDSSEKFDCFITGLTGALAAYVGERLKPVRLGANPQTLEIIALALLVTSIVLGFLGIERSILMLSLNHQRLHHSERRGTMMGVVTSGQARVDTETGEVWSSENAAAMAHQAKQLTDRLQEHLERQKKVAFRAYHWRNRLLLAGFTALVTARVLAAYI